MKWLRVFALCLISVLPQFAKRKLYKWLFGYEIKRRARLGLCYLDCQELVVDDDTRIGHFVVFSRCGKVEIGKKVRIGMFNMFRGGQLIRLEDYSEVLRMNVINAIPDNDCVNNPDPTFILGYGSVVTAEHRIDFTDKVSIGKCSILGGRNSSIWTHNRRKGYPVRIGDHCYVGSEIRIAPGGSIGDCCIVGIGSVITKPFSETFCLIAGVPAKIRRTLDSDDYELIFGNTRSDLPQQKYPDIPEVLKSK